MLRSLAIGFVVAALLQVGAYSVTSKSDLSLANAFSGSSLECQSMALGRMIGQGYRMLAR